jgi:SNF2 family DNA or RNA helicase
VMTWHYWLLSSCFAATAKAARQLQAKHKIILSGTPIQNNVQELWAVFDFLMPCFLGDLKSFEKKFGKPIAKGNCEGVSPAAIAEGLEALKLLHQTVSYGCSLYHGKLRRTHRFYRLFCAERKVKCSRSFLK